MKLTIHIMNKSKYDKCVYPDWEGGYITSEHHFDKDGYCCICGQTKDQSLIFKP